MTETTQTPTPEKFADAIRLAEHCVKFPADPSAIEDHGERHADQLAPVVLALAAQLAEANERTVSVSFPNHPLRGGVEREYTLEDIEPLLERAEQAEAAAAAARDTALEEAKQAIRRGCQPCEGSGRMPGSADESECEYCGRPMETIEALKSPPAPVTPSATDLCCCGHSYRAHRPTEPHECFSTGACRCPSFTPSAPAEPLPSPSTAREGE